MTIRRLKELERRAKSLVGTARIMQVGVTGFWYYNSPSDATTSFYQWSDLTVQANRDNETRERDAS